MNILLFNCRPWLVAGAALFLCGCVSQTATDTDAHFYYNPVFPIGIVVVGIAFIPIGFFSRKSSARIGWGLMTIVPLAALLYAATMAFEHVSVNEQRIEVTFGFFGSTKEVIPLDEVKQIRIVEESTGGRRRRMIDVFVFEGERGEIGRFQLNNDVKIDAANAIRERAKARGIMVIEKQP